MFILLSISREKTSTSSQMQVFRYKFKMIKAPNWFQPANSINNKIIYNFFFTFLFQRTERQKKGNLAQCDIGSLLICPENFLTI